MTERTFRAYYNEHLVTEFTGLLPTTPRGVVRGWGLTWCGLSVGVLRYDHPSLTPSGGIPVWPRWRMIADVAPTNGHLRLRRDWRVYRWATLWEVV